MRAWLVFALATGAFVGVGGCGGESRHTAPTAAGAERKPLERIEHVRSGRTWWAGCDLDYCDVPHLFAITLETSPTVATVDVVLTVTLDIRLTDGDSASLAAGYRMPDEVALRPMEPSALPVRSAPDWHPTTTTLTWVKRNLEASGREYLFSMSVVPVDGTGDHRVDVSGRKLTAVLETSAP